MNNLVWIPKLETFRKVWLAKDVLLLNPNEIEFCGFGIDNKCLTSHKLFGVGPFTCKQYIKMYDQNLPTFRKFMFTRQLQSFLEFQQHDSGT